MSNGLQHRAEIYTQQALLGYTLVFAASNDAAANQLVAKAAKALNIAVNVADQPSLSDFITPSVVDRSPAVIAVTTNGASPVLARMIRARIESLIPASYGRLAELLDSYRIRIQQRFSSPNKRRSFWESILSGTVPELVFSGRAIQAEAILKQAIDAGEQGPTNGEVYLVGAGPGDPDLLTFKALRLMQQADVVLYDRLVSAEIVNLVRRDAERIYVGKALANHAVPQESINQQLVTLALQGKRVLRLKGGDPFIFGRGGEEIEDLSDAGVPFQVVPGITAASGCASYAGIPLTHRDYSQSVSFVTGHLKDGSFNLNWQLLSQPNQTVVIYMGLTGLQQISDELMAHGVAADMPAALVQQGTTPNQRVITGSVSSLPALVEQAQITPPTLIIIGQTVSLQSRLNWFEPQRTEHSSSLHNKALLKP